MVGPCGTGSADAPLRSTPDNTAVWSALGKYTRSGNVKHLAVKAPELRFGEGELVGVDELYGPAAGTAAVGELPSLDNHAK